MIDKSEAELRTIALENAVKAISGYESSFNTGGTKSPGTPAPEVIVQRAEAYYAFLSGAKGSTS